MDEIKSNEMKRTIKSIIVNELKLNYNDVIEITNKYNQNLKSIVAMLMVQAESPFYDKLDWQGVFSLKPSKEVLKEMVSKLKEIDRLDKE